MKAILEFNLPEEQAEHKLALDGFKWMAICHELDQWLRSLEKHEGQHTLKVDEARSRLHEEMASSGLTFE